MTLISFNGFQFGGRLIIFVLAVSIIRGILVPDFRYNLLSVVVIQIIFPIVLFSPMLLKLHGDNFLGYFTLCLIGITLACVVGAVAYFFTFGQIDSKDYLSIPILIASYLAQVLFFSVLAFGLLGITKLLTNNS